VGRTAYRGRPGGPDQRPQARPRRRGPRTARRVARQRADGRGSRPARPGGTRPQAHTKLTRSGAGSPGGGA
jgi:hypothetical protein